MIDVHAFEGRYNKHTSVGVSPRQVIFVRHVGKRNEERERGCRKFQRSALALFMASVLVPRSQRLVFLCGSGFYEIK